MATELALGPVGAGKTHYALGVMNRVIQQQPFAPIWVLLPGKRQEDAFRQRLIDDPTAPPVYFNIHFFNFYSLYARLLESAGLPQRELDPTARLWLIRAVINDLNQQGQLRIFRAIADTPGFTRVIATFLDELKQNVIPPEVFAAAASSDKDRELALIYARYQDKLRENDLVDREGEGWLALDQVRDQSQLAADVALLLVDGFDQFNALQTQLVTLLSARTQQTLVTLPTVPGREATVGRRFAEAQLRLQTAHEALGQPLNLTLLSFESSNQRPPALQHLTENSFRSAAQPLPSDGQANWIEAPEPKQEAAAIIRAVKRLLLAGTRADDILIAVRDWERYGTALTQAARSYGVPVALHYGEPLATNPAIIAILDLLDIAGRNFRRREVIDALGSPYLRIKGLDTEAVHLLDKVSREEAVIAGQEDWLRALRQASQPRLDEDGDERAALLEPEQAQALAKSLTAFFNTITSRESDSIDRYIIWLEELLGSDPETDPDDDPANENLTSGLGIIQQIRDMVDTPALLSRDLIALHEFKHLLRNLLAAQRLLAALNLSQATHSTWAVFLNDLKKAVGTAAVERSPNRFGRVLITTVADGRGLPHRHVFIPGLSEGIFPAPTAEDPLYLDSERERLRQAGVLLETQAERAADEGLFYELISQARETLTLTRPTTQNGSLWPASHLWRAVQVIYSDAAERIEEHRLRPGMALPLQQAATPAEVALTVAAALNGTAEHAALAGAYHWLLQQQPQLWAHIRHARQIERRRMTRRGFDQYSGRLRTPRLLDWVAHELGPQRRWSASQFNDYGACGFRFFAKRLLKLEAIEEPEEGMDAAQRGTLNHAILEQTYARLKTEGIAITADHQEQAVATLREVAQQVFATAPEAIGFRQSALWQQEQIAILRKLEALMRLDFSEQSPLNKLVEQQTRLPYLLETPFSPRDDHTLDLFISDGLGSLRVIGFIDRMDRVGDQVIVVDYKTGSTTIPVSDMRTGVNFQMMLYLLASQVILDQLPDADKPTGVLGGAFWHISNQKTSGGLHLEDEDDAAALDEARARLTEHLQAGRAGDFAAHPRQRKGAACTHYCDYTHLCRIGVMRK